MSAASCWQLQGCWDGIWEKRLGASSCQTQPVPASYPTDPLQDAEEPIRWFLCDKASQRDHQREQGAGGNKKEWETAKGTPRSEEELQGGADIPEGTVADGGPTKEQMLLQGLQPGSRVHIKHRKSVRGKQQERGISKPLCSDHNCPTVPCTVWGASTGVWTKRVKLGVREGTGNLVHIFVSHYQNLF